MCVCVCVCVCRIWNLADVTRDGYLDIYEYALCRHFIAMKLSGW